MSGMANKLETDFLNRDTQAVFASDGSLASCWRVAKGVKLSPKNQLFLPLQPMRACILVL